MFLLEERNLQIIAENFYYSPYTPPVMARKAIVVKQAKRKEAYLRALSDGRKPKFPTRIYNRCQLCGRVRGYMGFFGICRICFRELAANGEIPGMTKSSW